MWILGSQGLRVSSYMAELIPPEAHLSKKGGGDIVGRFSGAIRRILVGSGIQVIVCICAINEGIPSGFRQGGASDCRCGGVSLRVLWIPAQRMSVQDFCGRVTRFLVEIVI